MLVGNGVTNWKYDGTPSYFHMAYFHGLIDDSLYESVNAKCDLSYYDWDNGVNLNDECKGYLKKFSQLTDNMIDIYDVYGKCYKITTPQLYGTQAFMTASQYTPFLARYKHSSHKNLETVPPCLYAKPILDYLRSDSVLKALHILP